LIATETKRTSLIDVPNTEAFFWTQGEVANWVKSFEDEGRTEIAAALQALNGQQLLALTNETLVARGLEKLGLRKKVLRSIQSLKEGNVEQLKQFRH